MPGIIMSMTPEAAMYRRASSHSSRLPPARGFMAMVPMPFSRARASTSRP